MDLRGRKWQEAAEDCIMRSFLKCIRNHILVSDRIFEDEMCGTCSTHGRGDKNSYKIFIGKLEGKLDHSEELGVDGKIILECIFGKMLRTCGLNLSGSR
jgi:hypothetical protein